MTSTETQMTSVEIQMTQTETEATTSEVMSTEVQMTFETQTTSTETQPTATKPTSTEIRATPTETQVESTEPIETKPKERKKVKKDFRLFDLALKGVKSDVSKLRYVPSRFVSNSKPVTSPVYPTRKRETRISNDPNNNIPDKRSMTNRFDHRPDERPAAYRHNASKAPTAAERTKRINEDEIPLPDEEEEHEFDKKAGKSVVDVPLDDEMAGAVDVPLSDGIVDENAVQVRPDNEMTGEVNIQANTRKEIANMLNEIIDKIARKCVIDAQLNDEAADKSLPERTTSV